ncbi:MAG TPA: hypothetical protein ENN84_08290, partial [Candidatus Marinimicrobia bacterium]|nr:hypothetical protein [Candidatus Neomarinimicrobiota bacterium]
GGQGHGWMTHFHSVPQTGDAIVILTNSQRSWPFFGSLLAHWSNSANLPKPKMHRISNFELIVEIFCWISAILLIVSAFSIAKKYILHKGIVGPAGISLTWRQLQIIGALLIWGILIWSSLQPYLFISSILPGLTFYLAILMFLTGFLLFMNGLLALLPGKWRKD